MTVEIEVAVLTSTGSLHRDNEDRVLVGSLLLSPDESDGVAYRVVGNAPFVVAVFDGMGGHGNGARAAGVAARELARHAPRLVNGLALADAVELANRRVYEEMTAETSGMGSTVCALVLHGDRAIVGNVGDSPCYEEVDGLLVEMTVADSHPATARLTQSLGGLSTHVAVEPHLFEDEMSDRRFLLMSDGISAVLALAEMEQCLAPDPLTTARQLVAAARYRGSTDDASIVLVRVVAPDLSLAGPSVHAFPAPTLPIPVLPPRTGPGGRS